MFFLHLSLITYSKVQKHLNTKTEKFVNIIIIFTSNYLIIRYPKIGMEFFPTIYIYIQYTLYIVFNKNIQILLLCYNVRATIKILKHITYSTRPIGKLKNLILFEHSDPTQS